MLEKLQRQMKFLAEADRLKTILRQTYVRLDEGEAERFRRENGATTNNHSSPRRGEESAFRQENSAEHSWHFALVALTLYEHNEIPGVNLDRVIKMAILHDLVEIYAGDTPAFDAEGNINKAEREQAAAGQLFSMLPPEQGAEFRAIWDEFEEMKSPDALFANAADRLQSFYQVHLSGGQSWKKYSVTPEQIFQRMQPVKTAMPTLWSMIEDIVGQYENCGSSPE